MLKTAQAIIDEVTKLVFIETGVNIPKIVLKTNGNITKALGYAEAFTIIEGDKEYDQYEITLNARAFKGKENSKVFRKIVIHEFCHIADMVISGNMNGHSRGWSQLMRMCNERPESLVAKEDTDFLGYSPYRYFHACNCKEHGVSLKMHRDIITGKSFDCTICNSKLSKKFRFN